MSKRAAISRLMFLVTFLLTAAALAQQQPNTASSFSTFETAAIHPARLTDGCFSMLPPGGNQYSLTCVSLKNLIAIAYKSQYIEGGGAAIAKYYDLHATIPDGKSWTSETIAPMMKQLLVERFHLTVHSAKRERSGYALILAKTGARLEPADPAYAIRGQKAGESSANFIAPGVVQGRGINSNQIARLLSNSLHSPVVDETNLNGVYNLNLRYAPDGMPSNPAQSDSSLPSFFTAVEEQLGLKLRAQKVSVDTIIVDHADSEPTPN
jgi:uncharacterized protein (TIGR03435 family)